MTGSASRPERPLRPRSSSEENPESSRSSRQRRGQPKVSTACERCRTKRIRCDGGRPTCTSCSSIGLVACDYDRQDGRRNSPLRREIAQLREERDSLKTELETLREAVQNQSPSVGVTSPAAVSLASTGDFPRILDPVSPQRRPSVPWSPPVLQDPLVSLRDMDSSGIRVPVSLEGSSGNAPHSFIARPNLQPSPSTMMVVYPDQSLDAGSMNRPAPNMMEYNPNMVAGQAFQNDATMGNPILEMHNCILVAAFGWNEAQRLSAFDRRWQELLRDLGQWISFQAFPSRVACLLLSLRTLTLKNYGNPSRPWLSPLPALPGVPQYMTCNPPQFMIPRPSQCAFSPASFVDIVPWPGFRERLSFARDHFGTTECFGLYMRCYTFCWTGSVEEMILKDIETGYLRLSDAFLGLLYNLKNHRLEGSFFQHYPDFEGDAAKTDPDVIRRHAEWNINDVLEHINYLRVQGP